MLQPWQYTRTRGLESHGKSAQHSRHRGGVRSRRRELGYTQAKLADRVGVGTAYLSNLENGKETAEIGKALHILRMLGMDLFVEVRS